MKQHKDSVVASTHPVSGGKSLSKTDIREYFSQLPDPYVLNQSHDQSLPPAGRGYNKKLVELPDGHLAITMDLDLYDETLEIDANGFSLSSSHITTTDGSGRTADVKVYFDEELLGETHGFQISDCSNEDVCISASSKIDRSADSIVITMVAFASIHVIRGFFEAAGKATFASLKKRLFDGGELLQEKTGKPHSFRFTTEYKTSSFKVEILVRCSQDQLTTAPDMVPDLDSLLTYLDDIVGDSEITKVVVELTNTKPFWKIVHFVDTDGRLVDV